MTLGELKAAIAHIAAPDGDGYEVRVYMRSGYAFEGAHYAPELVYDSNGGHGILRLDPHPINNDLPPYVLAISDIVAITRLENSW